MNNELTTDGDVMIGGKTVSMQTVQHIYNQVTEKFEKVSKLYKENYCTDFSDFENLNAKVKQFFKQYKVASSNMSVSVSYSNDNKDEFSSFERFKISDSSNPNPIENIRLTYNYLIILPETSEPQTYEIVIDVTSFAAILNGSGAPTNIGRISFQLSGIATGRFQVKYVDYNVARSIQVVVDDWFSSLNKLKDYPIIQKIQPFSHHIPHVIRLVGVAVYLVFSAVHFGTILSEVDINVQSLFLALVYTFGGAYLLGLMIFRVGNFLESTIDSISSMSFINITRGDDKLIKKMSKNNFFGIIRGVVNIISIIVIEAASIYTSRILDVSF